MVHLLTETTEQGTRYIMSTACPDCGYPNIIAVTYEAATLVNIMQISRPKRDITTDHIARCDMCGVYFTYDQEMT